MSRRLPLVLWSLFLLLACRSPQPIRTEVGKYPVEEGLVAPDSSIVLFLAPYKKQLEEEMNFVLGETAMELTKQTPESSLGNWMADVMHLYGEKYSGDSLDLAIANYGGIRSDQLLQGPVTRSDIFEVMPFDNHLVVMELEGEVLQQLFDHMAGRGGWPVSYSVRYRIEDGQPRDIMIKGKPLELWKKYKIALPDFIAKVAVSTDAIF